MANDSEDSRHKHRSSPGGEESREHSKRHKSRHHRHHHRRHSRHSKKHDEEMKEEIEERNEVANKVEQEEVKEIAPLGLLDKTRADYDMEEGEIIEDDDFCPGNGGIGNKDPVSDVEFGEIASAGARCEEGNSDSRGISAGESRDNRNLKATENDDCQSDSFSNLIADKTDGKKTQSHIDPDELTPKENDAIVYGDRSSTASARSHRRTGSLSKISGKRKGHFDIVEGSLDLMDVDEHEIGHQQNLFSCGSRMLSHRKVSRSPSHGRYHAEVHDKNRSKSVERVRERSHAQSVLHEVRSKSGHHEDDVLNDNWKTDHEADYERVTFPTADNRCNSKDLIKDKERRSSKQIRYTDREDSHYDRPSWDREREEKICRDRKMEREEERQRRDKNCEREMEHHKEMEKERDWRRDRDHEKKQEIGGERERVQERTRDVTRKREHDRDREGSMDRGTIRERDQERERRSNGCKAAYRDRSMERQWEKGRDKDGDRARDRQLDREGDGGRDRRGDRDRDIERSSRYHKYDDRDDGFGDRERLRGSKRRVYDGTEYHRGRCREDASGKDRSYEDDSARRSEDKLNRDDDDDQEDYQERVELKLAEQEEEDLNRIKEESRRRREAILQKYKTQQLQQEVEPKLGDARREDKEPLDPSFQPLATEDALPMNLYAEGNGQDAYVADPSFSVRKSPPENDTSAVEKTSGAGGLGEGTPTSERCSDMFCDDIFGDSPAGVRKSGKGDGLPVESNGLYDNWDDPEGYYSYRFGEVLDGRYEIAAAHGKGVFSTVVRAKDLKAGNGDPEEVAVKIIRNNETMLKAGMEELVILKKLVGADPEDRRHCVRFLSSFKYRNHLCLVFESLHMNLREVLKKFGRNIGLKLTAVRAYAKQLFIALKHLRNCGVLHCDIKPDNMLVNDAKNVLKLCDFGNAMFAGKNELTPYLVSRFYRAPEIILGLPYDHPLDMWSVGCCLYELYTGKVLFPGPTNNDMLRLHLELKGPFPKKMLRKGAFTDQHFDQDLNFLATEDDPVTKKTIKRLLVNIKPKDIAMIIKGSSGEDPKMLANFKDLLDKIFILDPDKRLTGTIFGWRPHIGSSLWEYILFLLNFPISFGQLSSAYLLRRHPGEAIALLGVKVICWAGSGYKFKIQVLSIHAILCITRSL
ncbi:hypothetical protein Nepgr_029358 [Nepenthes gracilis]|uniref:Serine/threonine-protein kinase PRP4 homolog n=1 Tax=Nepenthes gracilis TaxID=150966 RepID=A0AAD3TCB9_NEPGR|nr:hypothetical protein Nepgr_029358 [Nepenthes gracilis]